MKKHLLPLLFFFALCMLVTAAGAASISAPVGTLIPESTGVYSVSVGGLNEAQGVEFNLTFDKTLLSVESVSANSAIPGSSVTANINNESGWVHVAVTNTKGITVEDSWASTPLVDITFSTTATAGESSVQFAGSPTYSQGFGPQPFDYSYYGLINIRHPRTLESPSGTLASGQPGTFAVSVNNISDARDIRFSIMYDGSYLIIEDIMSALPGAVIEYADAYNGAFEGEWQQFGLESIPEDVRLEMEQHPYGTMANVRLLIPGGLTATTKTDIVDIMFQPTSLAGTGNISIHYGYYYDSQPSEYEVAEYQDFDLLVPGQIVTSGGGTNPLLGEFKAPSGTVDVGSQKAFPFMVRSLNNADITYIHAEWNLTVVDVKSMSLNATAESAGVTLDSSGRGWYSNEPIGYLYANLGNMTNLNPASWTSVLDVMVAANGTSGQTPVNISGSAYLVPRENVTISFPPVSLADGAISIATPQKPDLEGELIDPPRYVKKWANDTTIVNSTFKIKNNGPVTVTETFTIGAEFAGEQKELDIEDDIPANGHYLYYMMVYMDPNGPENPQVNIINYPDQYKSWYTITAKGDISAGDKKIGVNIDVHKDISEINETNNWVNTTATITRPDLIPVWKMDFISGIPSSNTTLLGTSAIPGTYEITLGAENAGNVYAVPTTLNYTVNGATTPYDVPRLEPGENWTKTIPVEVGRAVNTYRIEVNADRTEAETNYANNVYQETIGSVSPVAVVLPKVNGSTGDTAQVVVRLSNVSAPVTAFQIPLIYDPTVCYNSTPVSAIPGVSVTTAYGRIILTGSGLNLAGDADVATITMKAMADAGRKSVLDSQTNAYVKTTGGAFLELEITRGQFAQLNETNAVVSVFAPTMGSVNQNQTVSVTIQNQKSNPVTVSANLTANGVKFWEMSDITLAGRASKTFTISTWKPAVAGTYALNATIAGDDVPAGNSASRNIEISDYKLEITDSNKYYWNYYYGINKSVLINEYFSLGTYFNANQAGMLNATLTVMYPNGTPVNLNDGSVFDFYYWYPARQSVYGYNSVWNSVSWYYIQPKQLGSYNYSISLEAKGQSAFVNGTINVREPQVDIKVMNTTIVESGDKTLAFAVFNRTPSEGRKVQLYLAAGADGRTIQGLTSLIGYPHGCPEQTMSPALAALRVKQYYEQRGALDDAINATLQRTMQGALDRMNSPDGYNAQQASGGWAWGTGVWATPSMFYTLYPNYVIVEMLDDNDPAFWNVASNMSGIDLNASANWLINKQKADGHWSDWGYISNDVEWTGFISEKLANEYKYVNATMQTDINTTLDKSHRWLLNYTYTSQKPQAVSYAVFGLVAIRDHGIGNTTDIDAKIAELKVQLLDQKVASGGDFYWPGEYSGDRYTYEPTASAVLALNKSGLLPDDPAVSGGIRFLMGNRAGRSYSGGWGSTRTSAAVISTLTKVVPQAEMDFTVDAEIRSHNGATIWSRNDIPFNKTSYSFVQTLTTSELSTLYGFGAPNGTATVIISGKTDADPLNIAKLSVSIDSVEQVPESIAIATIPDMYIDPIATDFGLAIVTPNPGDLKEGDSWDVGFTINNNLADPHNQTVMIIEIPISNEVNFTGSALGADAAYYLNGGVPTYISHMYNATEKKLFIYPGSDDESSPSVLAGESKTFYAPLKFGTSGNITVEARTYPMYNDQWMALGSGSTYVKGYGNLTLAAVDENNAPVAADFYITGASVGSGTNVNVTQLEGTYAVSIKKDSSWVNSSVNVAPSESTTYTAHFTSDRTVPYIAQAEGAIGEIQMMPPEIEDTTDNTSAQHWNAAIFAVKNFTSTIASSGGLATISVEIPTLTRNIGTIELNDTVLVLVHNATGWFSVPSSGYSLEGGVLTLFNIDTADIDQVFLGFEGRILGDVDNSGTIGLQDVLTVIRSMAELQNLTFNDQFYGDIDDTASVGLQDILSLIRYLAELTDDNYQTL